MNDRELLELAAKAAGFEKIDYSNFAGMDVRYGFSEAIWNGDSYWNPLMDDGDALRLAVKLNLDIRIYGCVIVFAQQVQFKHSEYNAKDSYAATRRAIVRCAAEIGKAMP